MININYEELSKNYKRAGKISPSANTLANKLICELCIQLNGDLARLLNVDHSLDNHRAVRVWVQKKLNDREGYSHAENYDFLKEEIYRCTPTYM